MPTSVIYRFLVATLLGAVLAAAARSGQAASPDAAAVAEPARKMALQSPRTERTGRISAPLVLQL